VPCSCGLLSECLKLISTYSSIVKGIEWLLYVWFALHSLSKLAGKNRKLKTFLASCCAIVTLTMYWCFGKVLRECGGSIMILKFLLVQLFLFTSWYPGREKHHFRGLDSENRSFYLTVYFLKGLFVLLERCLIQSKANGSENLRLFGREK
jgi:hypothetical protein